MKGKWVQVGRNLNIQGMSYLVSFTQVGQRDRCSNMCLERVLSPHS